MKRIHADDMASLVVLFLFAVLLGFVTGWWYLAHAIALIYGLWGAWYCLRALFKRLGFK